MTALVERLAGRLVDVLAVPLTDQERYEVEVAERIVSRMKGRRIHLVAVEMPDEGKGWPPDEGE